MSFLKVLFILVSILFVNQVLNTEFSSDQVFFCWIGVFLLSALLTLSLVDGVCLCTICGGLFDAGLPIPFGVSIICLVLGFLALFSFQERLGRLYNLHLICICILFNSVFILIIWGLIGSPIGFISNFLASNLTLIPVTWIILKWYNRWQLFRY